MTCRMNDWDACSCGCARSRLGIVDLNGRLLTPSRTEPAPVVPSMGVGATGSMDAFRNWVDRQPRREPVGLGATVKLGRPITPAEQAGEFLGGGVRDFLVGAGLVSPPDAPKRASFPSLGLLLAGGTVLLLLLSRR